MKGVSNGDIPFYWYYHRRTVDTINLSNDIPTIQIPFWEKYTLSIQEAAEYFRVGEKKLRNLIDNNKDADFILWNGCRAQIKRKLFEDYIDRTGTI